jgi:hypothetical protein
MTNHQSPITPPPELAMQWIKQLFDNSDDPVQSGYLLIKVAAQYGADQELEACCKWLAVAWKSYASTELRAARRPKPPSLKKRALEAMHRNWNPHNNDDFATIARALEQLDD